MANALRNISETHLMDVLLRCLRKASQRQLLKMSSRRIFFKKSKKNFLLLFIYFLLFYIWSKLFQNVKFPRLLLHKKVSFLQLVYDVGFTTEYQHCSSNAVFLISFSHIRTEKRDFQSSLGR